MLESCNTLIINDDVNDEDTNRHPILTYNVKKFDMSDLEPNFVIYIPNGYSFRSLIQAVREVVKFGNVYFTEDHITLTKQVQDTGQKLIVHFSIQTSKLIYYHTYSSKEIFKIGINFSEFWQEIKNIPKGDNLIIRKEKNSDTLILRYGPNFSGRTCYKMQGVVDEKFIHPSNFETSKSPNIIIGVKEFSKGASYLKSGKGNFIMGVNNDNIIIRSEIQGSKSVRRSTTLGYNPAKFLGLSNNDINDIVTSVKNKEAYSTIEKQFPNLFDLTEKKNKSDKSLKSVDSDDEENSESSRGRNTTDDISTYPDSMKPYLEKKISIGLMKSFVKFSSLIESNGVVKVFIDGNLITLTSDIGLYGSLKIIIG